jgi:hypothetical protein
MSEIIHRLIDEVDGKMKVVGYEKHEDGKIYHKKWIGGPYRDIMPKQIKCGAKSSYIPHTRKDRWTGLTYADGRLVFERDLTEDEFGETGQILYYEGEAQYRVLIKGLGSFKISDNSGLTFLGIEGID